MRAHPVPGKGFLNYAFHDGLDPTDIIPIIPGYYTMEILKLETPHLYDEIKGFMNGALIFGIQGYIGDIGEQFVKEFDRRLGGYPAIYSCVQYDSLYHLAYTLDHAVTRGIDYENP